MIIDYKGARIWQTKADMLIHNNYDIIKGFWKNALKLNNILKMISQKTYYYASNASKNTRSLFKQT